MKQPSCSLRLRRVGIAQPTGPACTAQCAAKPLPLPPPEEARSDFVKAVRN